MVRRMVKKTTVVRRRRGKVAAKNARNPRAVAKIYKAPRTTNQIPCVQKLRYCEYFSISTGGSTTGQYAFRANGCHDPNYTGVGHQPMKWDQFKVFYNHYVVIGSKITVKHLGGGSGPPNVTAVIGIHLDDDATIPGGGDLRYVIEQGRSQFRQINNAADKSTKVSSKFSCKKFFNVKDVKDNVTRLGAVTSTDPSEVAVFNVWVATEDGSTTGWAGNFMAIIDYIVLFSETADVAAS